MTLKQRVKDARTLLSILECGWEKRTIFNQDQMEKDVNLDDIYTLDCEDFLTLNSGWKTIYISLVQALFLVEPFSGDLTDNDLLIPEGSPRLFFFLMEEARGFVSLFPEDY